MTKRQQIIDELISRLNATFSPIQIIRGYNEAVVTEYPRIFVLEELEKVTQPKTGVYQKQLTIIVKYFHRPISALKNYEDANIKIKQLQGAIDLDERFSGLVIKYAMTKSEITPYVHGIINITVTYDFTYIDDRTSI
jgi:hypothetical protein